LRRLEQRARGGDEPRIQPALHEQLMRSRAAAACSGTVTQCLHAVEELAHPERVTAVLRF
jgi:hypothetical protein